MSIKHAILAIMAEEPTHGYELKKRFDDALGTFWPLQQAQVYNNLKLLEKANFIELEEQQAQDGLPDRKYFRVTNNGQQELADWLGSPVKGNRKLKDEFYLKLTTLVNVLDQWEDAVALLWQQRDVYLQQLRDLEQALGQIEAQGDDVMAALLEGAILHLEADLVWLDRVEERFQSRSMSGANGSGQNINDSSTRDDITRAQAR